MKAFFVLLLLTACAQARLGDTKTACELRYNKWSKNRSETIVDKVFPLIKGPKTENATYHYEGWEIRVGYLNYKAVVMEYHREDAKQITDAQFQVVLEANRRDQEWTETPGDGRKRTDGATARLNYSQIRLESKAYREHQARQTNDAPAGGPNPKARL